jgi:glutathione S-transferase
MRWLLFTTTELEQPLWRIRRHTAFYPKAKRLPGELTLAGDEFAAMANVLERHMDGRTFCCWRVRHGRRFVLAYTLDWAKITGLLKGLPRLERYVEQMYARLKAPMRLKAALASVGL